MTDDPFAVAWWTDNLEELDREIARLAILCQVKLLEPGIIARLLHKDASVCGADNPRAFARLRELLLMHLALRGKSADTLGPGQISAIEDHIVGRLAKSFPELGKWPPR
jgi:hypothetical protein